MLNRKAIIKPTILTHIGISKLPTYVEGDKTDTCIFKTALARCKSATIAKTIAAILVNGFIVIRFVYKIQKNNYTTHKYHNKSKKQLHIPNQV